MSRFHPWLVVLSALGPFNGLATAQVGVITGPANSLLSCTASAAGTPELRPEGYTELLGDIVITCTGGPVLDVGANVPTNNLIVYVSPSVPITSRTLGPGIGGNGTFVSDALLIIDEAGDSLTTGATGGYGPQAPQSVCTVAQETQYPSPCTPVVGLDASGNYQVSVVAGTSTPAPNVYQGEVGDYGANSVAFYNVPALPPGYQGVSRTFRITNIRIPLYGGNISGTIQAIISTNPNQTLPVARTALNIGVVGPSMTASVNGSPAGGGNPFTNCAPLTVPTLTSRITFTEGFASAFKTRVVPGGAANGPPSNGGNTIWAAEAQNLVSPTNQNIPGGIYGGFADNNESGFVLPSLTYTDTTSNITHTAGLADYGTRLKAVFSSVPAGATIYVSTASTGTVAVPGGTSVIPYAVLVGAAAGAEGNGDGTTFAPLTATTTGSDGAGVYPLAADNSGVATAVWEVVNASPIAMDTLTFGVYIAYGNTPGTVIQPTNVTLSYSPEPGGGTFSSVDATFGLSNPLPRFDILQVQPLPYVTINACPISIGGGAPVNFTYSMGASAPSGRIIYVSTNPSNLIVTATPLVTTPSGGTWLLASLNSGVLTISVDPTGLAASTTAYTGNIQLLAGGSTVSIPVNLTVYPAAQFSVTSSHVGNFAQSQQGTYSVVVSNASASVPTSGALTVTEILSPGLTLVSMVGTGWHCNTVPTCNRSDTLDPGASYLPIIVTVNVASNAPSPQSNGVSVSSPGLLDILTFDQTAVTGQSCDVGHYGSFTLSDLQSIINEAMGSNSVGHDLNFDGVVTVADVQLVLNSVLTQICVI